MKMPRRLQLAYTVDVLGQTLLKARDHLAADTPAEIRGDIDTALAYYPDVIPPPEDGLPPSVAARLAADGFAGEEREVPAGVGVDEALAQQAEDEREQRRIWESRCPALLAMYDALVAEVRRLEADNLSRHRAYGTMHARALAAEGRLSDLQEALERLASSEGFEGAGMIDGGSFAERELRARMRFAEETLARAVLVVGEPPETAPLTRRATTDEEAQT